MGKKIVFVGAGAVGACAEEWKALFRKREHHSGRIKFGFCDRFRERASHWRNTSFFSELSGWKQES